MLASSYSMGQSTSANQTYGTGYALVDQDLMILACNAAFLDWIEGRLGRIVGQTLPMLLPELVGVEDVLYQLTRQPTEILSIPKIYRVSADPRGRYFDLLIEPLPHFGPILLVLAIDVTAQAHLELALRHERNELRLQIRERARAEAALRQAKEQLEEIVAARTAELQQANTRLLLELEERTRAEALRAKLEAQLRQSQKMEAVGRLAGGIAHDFNNLLTVINGYSDLLLQHFSDQHPLRRDVEQIRKAGERAAALTRRLLAFSRQQILQPRVLDLSEVITDLEKMLRRLIGANIELVTQLAPALKPIEADPSQLEQLLLNLVVNARDAMPDSGKLTIAAANIEIEADDANQQVEVKPGEYVKLMVSDTGLGMTDEVKAHLFEPFFTTKEPGKGTGLGLAICFGIVKQSNGYIEVESEVGRGTTFTILLPAVAQTASPIFRPTYVHNLPGGTETILVVEDSAEVRELICGTLLQQGYGVLEASNGEAGLRLAETRLAGADLHLVITDLVMPQLGGRELARRLRAIYPGLKLLFISGYADTADLEAIVHLPYLQKPFSPELLIRKVREVLDS
jgi:signal transduction histidine kinase